MIEELNKLYDEGLLHKQFHPTYPLIIWNYSPRVQYEKLWTPILMMCRGLVTDFDGKIIARPFSKFFNYEEHKPEDIPNEHYEVFEKMDGSLGILFYYERELTSYERDVLYSKEMEGFMDTDDVKTDEYYDEIGIPKKTGEWIMATRGSFTSPQAIKGKEILDRHDISSWRKDNTYLFEIIYPENRIVVDYKGEEKLVVIGGFHTETGEEIPYNSLFWTQESGFEVVMTYKTWGESYDLLKEEIQKDREGYVIRFKNGFRMKIKGEEYKRLHKILTNVSNRDIWEYLKDNKPFDELLEKVPDEFNDWVKETVRDLTVRFENIDNEYNNIFNSIYSINKKDFAEKAKQYPHSSLLFAMYNGKHTHKIIWKLLYPNYSKPFKKDNI